MHAEKATHRNENSPFFCTAYDMFVQLCLCNQVEVAARLEKNSPVLYTAYHLS